MMLLSLHIIAVAALVGIIGSIAYQMGKTDGIRITTKFYKEQEEEKQQSPPPSTSPEETSISH